MTERVPLSVLVAEDNPGDVFLIRQALIEHGINFTIDVVTDGEQALDYIDRLGGEQDAHRPELILLDLNLPRHSGHEDLKRIRNSPSCKDAVVVVVTSSGAPKDRETTKELGADAYFRKPSNLDEFMKLGDLVRSFGLRRDPRHYT